MKISVFIGHDPWLKISRPRGCEEDYPFYRGRDLSKKIFYVSILLGGRNSWKNYPFLSIPSSGQYSWKKISGFIDPVANGMVEILRRRYPRYRFHQIVLILRRKIPGLFDPIKWSLSFEEDIDPIKWSWSFEGNYPFLLIPLQNGRRCTILSILRRYLRSHQVVAILGRKLSVLIDPIAMVVILGRKNSFHRSRREPSKVLIDPIKWSRFLEENHPFLSIPLQM
ncbi:1902_t:CDS:2, partial [Funneliformis geosporum]